MAVMDFGDALNLALREEMRRDPRVYCIGEDIVLGVPFGVTKGLAEEFGPARVRNAPISEAAIVGSAMGAAITGLIPVVDMHFADFVTCAMDEVANQIAKSRYMFGGQISCPLTLRMPYGIGKSAGGHHSNSVEAWFVSIPGLKVCIPSDPADARALLKSAIRDPDPVVFFEHKSLLGNKGEVPDGEHVEPLGQARVLREGGDATIIALAAMVPRALKAAETLAAEHKIQATVIDVRSLVPLDAQTILAHSARTGRVFTVEENPRLCGWGAEIASIIQEEVFSALKGPVVRITTPHVPLPAADQLEDAVLPSAARIAAEIKKALDSRRAA